MLNILYNENLNGFEGLLLRLCEDIEGWPQGNPQSVKKIVTLKKADC